MSKASPAQSPKNAPTVEDLRAALERVRTQLTWAQTHFNIWRDLGTKSPERTDPLNSFNGFFVPTRYAHARAFYLTVANTTDTKYRGSSFYGVLKLLRENPALIPGLDFQAVGKRLKALRKAINNVHWIRDTRFAHADIQPADVKVTTKEFSDLLEELQDIFNLLYGKVERAQALFEIPQRDHTEQVLWALEEYERMRKAEWERELRRLTGQGG